jgi:phosphoribosylanthranilate isomerase
MTLELAERPTHALLEAARSRATETGLPYAGGLSPQDAWALVQAGDAVLVDVRA